MLSVTLFVDADAPAGGDGLGWDSAYHDLQAALDDAGVRNADSVAENDVDQIWIAEGVYRPSAELEAGVPRSASFSLVDGVTLYGGFSGTETALEGRDSSANVTTLSGDIGMPGDGSDNAYTVVYCGLGIEAGVDGVSIVEGRADGISNSSHRERTCGGGIFNDDGTLAVTNSKLSGNSAKGHGGGICSDDGTLTVTDSTLSENSAGDGGGGGIYNYHGTLTIINSTLSKNSADGGGGICTYGTLKVTNSTLSGNAASYEGGGIYSVGTLTVTNSTLSGNAADYGGGIWSSGTLTVTNSTLSGNSAGAELVGEISASGTLTVADSGLAAKCEPVASGGGFAATAALRQPR